MEPKPQAENAAPSPSSPTPAPAAPAPENPASNDFYPDNGDDILFGNQSPAPPEEASEPVAPAAAEPVASPEPAPSDPTPEPPSEPEPPAGEETPPAEPLDAPVDPTEPAAPVPDKVLPHRISTAQFSDVEKRAIALSRELRESGEPQPLSECIKIVQSRDEQARAAQTQSAEEEERSNPITLLEQEVADLDSKLEDGSLIGPEIKLYTRKVAELAALRATNQVRSQTIEDRQLATRDLVADEYPAVRDQDSHLGAAVVAEIARMQQRNDPDLAKPDAPRLVVTRVANRLADKMAAEQGMTKEQALTSLAGKPVASAPKKAPVTPPAAAAPKAAPKPAITVASGNQAPAPPAKGATESEILARSLNFKDKGFDIDKALGYDDVPMTLGSPR